MSPDNIIRIAHEAGLCNKSGGIEGDAGSYYDYAEEIISAFQAAFKAGAAAEREACAVAAEKQARWIGYNAHAEAISAAIRAGGMP